LALVGTLLLNGRYARTTTPELVEFPILPPEGSTFARSVEFAVSPDGRHVAFVSTPKAGPSLWVRSWAAADPWPLPGTEGARDPFWSPDSQSIGFFAGDQLKKVQANGQSPADSLVGSGLLPGPTGVRSGFGPGGTWNSQGVIVFGPSLEGNLYQINVKKRTPTPVTKPAIPAQRRPSFLPDGHHFFYTSWGAAGTPETRVGSLTTADTVVIGSFEFPAYASGRLFFVRGGNLVGSRSTQTVSSWTAIPCPLECRSEATYWPRSDSRSPRPADSCSFRRRERNRS
jgi:hypothetical protein